MKITIELKPEATMNDVMGITNFLKMVDQVESAEVDTQEHLITIREYLVEKFHQDWAPGFDMEFGKEFAREYKKFYEKPPLQKNVTFNGFTRLVNAYTKEELIFAAVVLDEKFPGMVETCRKQKEE